MASRLWELIIVWGIMLLLSVANGACRDFTYGRHIGELAAHQLSTVTSIIVLGLVIFTYIRLYPPHSSLQALGIGLFWMVLTIAFEFLFFHYVGGHSWSSLLENYNVLEGRVWVLVLLWIAIAPYLALRIFPLTK
ncbi:hypothetical protein [Desulfosediminicola ganghwensis]|uniref:hypothetical protein n=1 Tax=Desulfosediminicola ganghwensis TaxID=2569540 RepID=UPI0010AC53D2|nr:hypothetical protein [Desulfosediminicola ganghwensis]